MTRDDHDFDEARDMLDDLYELTQDRGDAKYLWRLLHRFLREVEADGTSD